MALATRLFVGIGWWRLFKEADKRPWYAFVPFLGPYTAFRLVWDDFSFSFLFGGSTVVAFIDAVGVENGIVHACAIFNFIMWWVLAILTKRAYKGNIVLTFLYGGIPWLGVPLMGWWPRSGNYQGAWSSDPEAEQNLSPKERKKRRKKAAKAEKAAKRKK